ncbi:MAG TPA: hypothetical protein VGQ83_03035 [Polyangia bacterium]
MRLRPAASLLALAALVAASPRAAAAPGRSEQLQLLTCARPGGEYTATLTGRIVLHRAFVAAGAAEEAEIRASIKQQIRYLWGHYRTNATARRELRVVLSGAEPAITIRAKTVVPYGRDLTLDWKVTGQHLRIDDPYTTRAVARGRVRRDDPALAVTYEARFTLGICGQEAAPGAALEVPLPLDPWLFYWHVPARDRRPMAYNGIVAVTNPCSDDDFAELPHPFYYWYDWQPERRGPDAAGARFDCRRLLAPGVDFFPFRVGLARVGAASADFGLLRRQLAGGGPITATVLLGVLDHSLRTLPAAALGAAIGAGGDGLAQRAAAAQQRPFGREPGTFKLLQLLADLGAVARPGAFSARVEDGLLRVDVAGVLKRSGRPLRLRAYLGLTDVFGPVPPRHWAVLRRALAEDHLVVYAGHSGIGENFRLERIERHLGVPHPEFVRAYRRAPFQLIAFLSCYSYMYFGQDLLAAGLDRAVARGEFVFTGDEYTKGDRGALALLDLVDQALAPDNPAGTVKALRFLDPEDFWIVKEAGRELK